MRTDYISWENFGMEVARIVAKKSKDPNTQVGACIPNKDRRIVATGYNGMPAKCYDETMPWMRDSEDPLDNKYLYIIHAEQNAILNAVSSVKGGTIFVTLFPCNECAKLLIQTGIERVVYKDDLYPELDGTKAAKFLFERGRVTVEQYKGDK